MNTIKTLFIKPDKTDKILYRTKQDRDEISFRSLLPQNDINFLYTWVHLPYSKTFWQQDVSKGNLLALYKETIANPMQHSFIGLCNGQPVCQIDLYAVETDELSGHIPCQQNDCGFHLLMHPPKQSKKGLSLLMLRHFIEFYFSFPQGERLFAEPDRENNLANLLAKKAGFQLLKSIQLSYKTANLYCITKQEFQTNRNEH